MAVIQVTLNIQSTDLAVILPILCNTWNQQNTPAGAKQALILYLQNLYAGSLQQAAVQAAIATATASAQTTANAVIIT